MIRAYQWLRLAVAVASLVVWSRPACGQVAYYSLERLSWVSQAQDALAPITYQFQASVSGANLSEARLESPTTQVDYSGNSLLLSYSTNFPGVTTNLTDGLTNLDAVFPVGDYALTVETLSSNANTGRTTARTNVYDVAFTNDFCGTQPRLSNPQPPTPLQSTQSISWPGYAASAGSYTALYVLEGSFDAAFFQSIVSNGVAALTNFSLKVASPNLATTTTNCVATNLDATLDHIIWLEFDVASPQGQLPLNAVSSATINLSLFPGQPLILPPMLSAAWLPQSNAIQILVTGSPRTAYSMQASTNAGDGGWQVIGGGLLNSNGLGTFSDSVATSGSRYYRATSQQ
jgi:hypothetical protein